MPSGHIPEFSMTISGIASIVDPDMVELPEEAKESRWVVPSSQDCLDACLYLLVALYLVERKDCLMVGDQQTGYIVVPNSESLCAELETRCHKTGREPSQWVHVFRMHSGIG